jgi:hypothetical protein
VTGPVSGVQVRSADSAGPASLFGGDHRQPMRFAPNDRFWPITSIPRLIERAAIER